MTDSTLDRLLELKFEQFKVDAYLRKPLTEHEQHERQHLRSQLESKLAQAEELEKILSNIQIDWAKNGIYGDILTQIKIICKAENLIACQRNEQELAQLRKENEELESKIIPLSEGSAMLQMELERLRPIVEALKARLNRLPKISGHIHEYWLGLRKCKECEKEKIERSVEDTIRKTLQSILATSEGKA